MPARRELKPFDSLAAIVADAEMLLASGYDRAGSWSLGQCCGHLTNWLDYQRIGYPPIPLALKPVFFIIRNTIAKGQFRKTITTGTMPAGVSTVPSSVPDSSVADAAEVARFKQACEAWEAYDGPLLPSPIFGTQTREDWRQLHLIHAAHHLSFLIPKQRA